MARAVRRSRAARYRNNRASSAADMRASAVLIAAFPVGAVPRFTADCRSLPLVSSPSLPRHSGPERTQIRTLLMRHSLFSAVAALALMAAPAFAGRVNQTNTAPTHQNATSDATAKHGSASGLSLDN